MPKNIEGSLDGKGRRFAIVIGRFNSFVTRELTSGAADALRRHGVADNDVTTVWVPGCFELPLVAMKLAQSGNYDAIICLGAVIRGATSHYDLVCGEAARGVGRVGRETGVPAVFGVITTDTIEQAIERAGTKAGNKGFDAAMTALEMANLVREL